MSYNKILNPTHEYKLQLIEALVQGAPLPDINTPTSIQEATTDPLLDHFSKWQHDDVAATMKLQYDRFGPLQEELFVAIIAYIRIQIDERDPLAKSLAHITCNYSVVSSLVPTKDLFQEWRKAQAEYYGPVISFLDGIIPKNSTTFTSAQIVEILNKMLEFAGLAKEGWHAATFTRTNLVSVAKSRKRLSVAPHTVKLSKSRLIGLIIHEVYIHALWLEQGIHSVDAANEEGTGMLVEQLSLHVFHPLRFYRYLAICFAAGLDGKPRDARQVYELLCMIRSALKPREDTMTSRYFVAKELVRVYRNLPTNLAGLVYIRDKIYVENNAKLWSKLATEEPTQENYSQIVKPTRESNI